MTTLDTKPRVISEELSLKRWFMVTRSLTFQMLPHWVPPTSLKAKNLVLIPYIHALLQNNLILHCFLDKFLESCSQRPLYHYVFFKALLNIIFSVKAFWISHWKKFPLSMSSFSNFLSHLAHSTWQRSYLLTCLA